VQLKHGVAKVEQLKEKLRKRLPEVLPGVRFSFEPSDIVSRVMSFGSPTPVQVAVTGQNLTDSRAFAQKVSAELAKLPALRDLQYEQSLDYPAMKVEIDRERAGVLGVNVEQIAKALIEATSSSRYTSPSFWADPKTGVGYQIQVEIPFAEMNSAEAVRNVPVADRSGRQISVRNVADVTDGKVLGEYDRYNMQRTITLNANISGEDLGSVADKIDKAVAAAGKPPEKVTVAVRGQISPMRSLLDQLSTGLLVAVLVIFLMLAATFQSFRLSLAVVLTVPAVAAGVGVALLITGTTLNIQSFMGAIMAIGVAVANAILLITFAERYRVEGMNPRQAAREAAASRLRPILMTGLAMIAGMTPMAIGFGEGGEQTAPLGRAVIGGLIGATIATLGILPAMFALLQRDKTRKTASIDPEDPASRHFQAVAVGEDGTNGNGASRSVPSSGTPGEG
jgi:multidrug efflux pump subunit AcrB